MQEFVRKALRDRVDEGFRYFKLDFLWARNLKTRHDWKKTRLEMPRDIYRVYREAVGEDFYILAWSFWDEKYLGIVDESFVAKALPGHGSAQLRLTQISDDRPVVIGSTLHVAMDSAEIKNVESSADGMTVTLTDAGAREGKLFIHSPRPLALSSVQGCEASVAPVGKNLYCVTLSGRQRSTPNIIRIK